MSEETSIRCYVNTKVPEKYRSLFWAFALLKEFLDRRNYNKVELPVDYVLVYLEHLVNKKLPLQSFKISCICIWFLPRSNYNTYT